MQDSDLAISFVYNDPANAVTGLFQRLRSIDPEPAFRIVGYLVDDENRTFIVCPRHTCHKISLIDKESIRPFSDAPDQFKVSCVVCSCGVHISGWLWNDKTAETLRKILEKEKGNK